MRVLPGVLALSFAFALVSACGEKPAVEKTETEVSSDPLDAWLEEGGVLRRGGNGRIDSEVLSVACMQLEGQTEESLLVWIRYRHLDSSWTWKMDEHPVFARVEIHEGEALTRRSDLDASAPLGDRSTPSHPMPGDTFVTVAAFDAPPEDANLVVRTFTKRDGRDFELVAVLVPPENRREPPPPFTRR